MGSDRDLVTISVESAVGTTVLTVTSGHWLLTDRHRGCPCEQVEAGNLRIGDSLITLATRVTIRDLKRHTRPERVIKIELDNSRSTIFVGAPNASRHVFIEVFGAAWNDKRSIQILAFRRFNQFREALLESHELELCRANMQK